MCAYLQGQPKQAAHVKRDRRQETGGSAQTGVWKNLGRTQLGRERAGQVQRSCFDVLRAKTFGESTPRPQNNRSIILPVSFSLCCYVRHVFQEIVSGV